MDHTIVVDLSQPKVLRMGVLYGDHRCGYGFVDTDLMQYGFPHFRFIEFFTLHGALIVAVVYMTFVDNFRPTWKSLPRAIVITNVLWLFDAWVNSQIGSNYLYTQGKLPTPSLLDVLGPYPWYLFWMEAIGIALCVLLYLPFEIKDQRPGKKQKLIKSD